MSRIKWKRTKIKYLSQTYNGKVGSITMFCTNYDEQGIKLYCTLPGINDSFHCDDIESAKKLAKEIWKLWCKNAGVIHPLSAFSKKGKKILKPKKVK